MKTTETKAAIIENVDIKAYHNEKEHISASRLKRMLKSPLHFITEPVYEQKKSFDIGNAFEMLLLEVDKFDDNFAVFDERERPNLDKDFRDKENKAFKAAFTASAEGKTVLTSQDFASLIKMLNSVDSHPFAKTLIKDIMVQASIYFEIDEVKFKSRPDVIPNNMRYVLDVKTTRDASPDSFAKDAANYGYYIQADTQLRAVQAIGGKPEHYFYLVVENQAPFDCVVYELSEDDLNFSNVRVDELITQVKECQANDHYPGIAARSENPQGIVELNLPAWAKR